MKAPFKLTLVTILFAWQGVFAQDNLPEVYELKTDTATVYKLEGKYSQMLEDPEDNYTIEQVASPAFRNHFHTNETAQKGYNRKIHTYWFRFRIQNQLDREVELYFDNNYQNIKLYRLGADGKWEKQQTGYDKPWSQRTGLQYAHKLPFLLKADEQALFYQRIEYNPYRRTLDIAPPSFSLMEQFLKKFYWDTADGKGFVTWLIKGITIGIWLIAVVFNLAIFILLREKVYLYFCLWVFLYCYIHFNPYLEVLFFKEYTSINLLILPTLNWVTASFQVLFIRNFLDTRWRLPHWDRALVLSLGLYALSTILRQSVLRDIPISALDIFGPLIGLFYFLACLIIGIITIKLARRGDDSARFLSWATIPIMLFIGIGQSLNAIYFMFIKDSFLSFNTVQIFREIGTVWMVIIFSGAILRRYNQTRKELAQKALEKERLEKEKEIERSQLIEAQKIELEKQVAERTAQVVTQKEEIKTQRDNLERALEELKATQDQLVQREKMASLGELTAGIAHEIQNPLNFVNNFSEVSIELLTEMQQELTAGDTEEAVALADDVKENLQKIQQHGHRADAIVKGMLQHSRASSGEKQLTNLNTLTEEYLRLSYHGLRAQDKDFNAHLLTDFNSQLGKVEVVPQEIGRVLLNLFNNAFYATQQKKAQLNGQYQPEVKVSTCQQDGIVEIRVRDNGTGMPENVKSKIFQPFFTTKPTGQGTGLGLSLSYDIITKGHGGELRVESKEGEFTEMLILLPVPA